MEKNGTELIILQIWKWGVISPKLGVMSLVSSKEWNVSVIYPFNLYKLSTWFSNWWCWTTVQMLEINKSTFQFTSRWQFQLKTKHTAFSQD